MKSLRPLPRLLALLFTSVTAIAVAHADPVTLTFEGIPNETSIGSYYDGVGGPDYGITFSADSLALVAGADGGSGNFSNNPSGDTVAFFLAGSGDIMDVAAGFTTGFSFYYASSVVGDVTVWSGLDGTGTLLATLDLAATPSPYSVWEEQGVSFSGVAESVDFGGSANAIAFDNITLGSQVAGTGASVPDTASTLLCLVGAVACLIGLRRRLPGFSRA